MMSSKSAFQLGKKLQYQTEMQISDHSGKQIVYFVFFVVVVVFVAAESKVP